MANAGSNEGSNEGPNEGILWSVPVLIQRGADGALTVALPEKVARHFDAAEGDVLNWTRLPDGTVEAWSIKKSTYSSLGDMNPGANAAAGAPDNAPDNAKETA